MDFPSMIATPLSASFIAVPTTEYLTAMRSVLFYSVLVSEIEAVECEELEALDSHLKALVIHHSEPSLRILRRGGRVQIKKSHTLSLLPQGIIITSGLLVFNIGALMAAMGPLWARSLQGKLPLTKDLMTQAMDWQVCINWQSHYKAQQKCTERHWLRNREGVARAKS